MNSLNQTNVTMLLNAVGEGRENAPEKLLEAVYDDLRRLAGAYMKKERDDHTLQPTALVHEAYLRLIDWKTVTWENRAQFFAVAAQVMRRVLVDHARQRGTHKRGSSAQKIQLEEVLSFPAAGRDIDLLRLEDALETMEKQDPRQAKIVELRFFGGLTIEETAHVLNVSEMTVKREWTFAKTWFLRELTRD